MEIELKFQVSAASRAAVQRAVATARARTVRLQAHYFDTPDSDLAREAVALRLRREEGLWIQTLKAAGRDGLHRLEHNVPLGRARSVQPPPLQLDRHDGHPAADALQRALQRAGGVMPLERYGTVIGRTLREVSVPGARVELAFDEGWIQAGDRRVPVCELELELLRGDTAALLALAERWTRRFPLVLDVRTKSERGHWLALQREGVPPQAAAAAAGAAGAASTAACARDAVVDMLRAALAPALANASQITAGPSEPEHLHQLRVAVRRLMTVLQVFPAFVPPEVQALLAPLRELQHVLGQARDLDVLAAPLRQAWQAAGATAEQAAAWFHALGVLAAHADAEPGNDAVAGDALAARRLADARTQRLWLHLLAATQPRAAAVDPAASPAAPLNQVLLPLERLYRQVRRGAGRAETLDDDGLHRLRRRIKRLRYAIECVDTWLPQKRREALLRSLRGAQEALGQWHDTVIAQAAARRLADVAGAQAVPQQWIAVGWLAAQAEQRRRRCVRELAAWAKPSGARRARKAWRATGRRMQQAQGH
jgi:triphosphatase